MASGNIDILLTARDQYSRALEEMKSKIRSAQQSANDGARGIGADVARSLFSLDAILRTVDGGIRGVADGMAQMRQEGTTLFEALIVAGEKFVSTLQRIPVAGAAGTLLGEGLDSILPGLSAADEQRNRDAVDRMLERARAADTLVAASERQAEAIARARQRIADALKVEGTSESDALGTTGFDRRFQQLYVEQRKELEALETLAREARNASQRAEVEQLREHVEQLFSIRRQALNAEQAEKLDAMNAERREAEQLERERMQRDIERSREAAERKAEIERREYERLQQEISRVRTFREPSLGAFESRFLRDAPTSVAPNELVQVKDQMGNVVALVTKMTTTLDAIHRGRIVVVEED